MPNSRSANGRRRVTRRPAWPRVLLYRTQGTYDQHLDDVERICKAALNTTDICYVELATVYQEKTAAGTTGRTAQANGSRRKPWHRHRPARRQRRPRTRRCHPRYPGRENRPGVAGKIAPGYPASWVSLAQLLYDFPELGDVEQMMKYLDNGRAADQPRAELLLGKPLLRR